MCSCNKGKKKKVLGSGKGGQQSFVLEGGGKTQTFGSRLEARAENVRQFGGRGKVSPA